MLPIRFFEEQQEEEEEEEIRSSHLSN